jgi:hypothetical protein
MNLRLRIGHSDLQITTSWLEVSHQQAVLGALNLKHPHLAVGVTFFLSLNLINKEMQMGKLLEILMTKMKENFVSL